MNEHIEYAAYMKVLNARKAKLRAQRRLTDYGTNRNADRAEEVLSRAVRSGAQNPRRRWRRSWVLRTASNLVFVAFAAVIGVNVVIGLRNIAPEFGVIWIGDPPERVPIFEWIKRISWQ